MRHTRCGQAITMREQPVPESDTLREMVPHCATCACDVDTVELCDSDAPEDLRNAGAVDERDT